MTRDLASKDKDSAYYRPANGGIVPVRWTSPEVRMYTHKKKIKKKRKRKKKKRKTKKKTKKRKNKEAE